MKLFIRKHFVLVAWFLTLLSNETFAQELDEFICKGSFHPDINLVNSGFQFNGYTDYWHDTYRTWARYGNLFKMAAADVEYTIAQGKVDVAGDMKMPGLRIQEGFINGLLSEQTVVLDQPSLQKLSESLGKTSVLVLTDPTTETGKKLAGNLPEDAWKDKLKSHQFGAKDFTEVRGFYLENGPKKIYVISSTSRELRTMLQDIINATKDLLNRYDLHRGWFGAETLLKSVTCAAGHPLEVIGKGMNEGNTWFTFSGYMDFLAQKEIDEWLRRVNLPVVADVGTNMNYIPTPYNQAIYGCKNYDGLLVQSMYTLEYMLKYVHDRNGYAFRSLYDPAADMYPYDGYLAGEGDKEHVDKENVPFVTNTGSLDSDAVPCMMLFVEKGKQLTKELMWESIMERREVAVLEKGLMMGPELFRNALELLLLDRVYLEEHFGDRINLEAFTDNYQLSVTVTNTYPHAVTGILGIVLPPELRMRGDMTTQVSLPAYSSKTLNFKIQPLADAMNRTNPIAVHYNWEEGKKSTLTMLDLPPAISAHQLLYGHAPRLTYPVTIHNFTDKPSFPVEVKVLDINNSNKVIYTTIKTCTTETGTFCDMAFDLEVPAGSYQVNVSALGIESLNQLGVGKAEGSPELTAIDLNNDGVDEYIMENDSVKITLLATGGRVIEYIIKSRNDNALYRIWPVKPVDDKREFRKRGYYPYGGFEDFLGQASMETHKLYNAEITRKEGDQVQVKMTADYFGNKLEKTYTLYGNSPLLEVRFAITFSNPEANMIAPVPVLELGEKHGTEDVFIVPAGDGLQEFRMLPERYYGRIFFPAEGWDAGYDTREDISFISAFPVKPPLFLHMFMNHPVNQDAHFYCHEFQPWVPILQKSTTYFTFYMWGAGGRWERGVQALRDRNLITEQ